MPQSQVTYSSLIQLWATSSLLLRCKPSSEHAPDEMLVREILQENQPFFECSVLLARPSTSGQEPVRDGKKTAPKKSTMPTWLHFSYGTCWHFSTGTFVRFSERIFLHLVSGAWKKYGNYVATRSKQLDTHTGAHFIRCWAVALLRNLLAGLVRHLVALGISHLGSDIIHL